MAAVIDPGRYVVVRTSGFVPAVIRAATHSRVDHALIVISDRLCVEAEPGGVIVSPLAKYKGCYARANLAEPMTAGQRIKVAAKAKALVDVPYNFAAIGDDVFQDLLRWPVPWLLHLAAADHDLDCSQLVAFCGHDAGANWQCGRPAFCAVTPGDLDRRRGMVRVHL